MSKDFRTKQLRAAQIIASGTDWAGLGGGYTRAKPNLGMFIYSSSASTNFDGGVQGLETTLNESGNEAWLIISGSSTAKQQVNRPPEDGGSVLFMGDVIVSGTLFGKRQVIIVDKDVPGDLFVKNAFHLSGNMYAGPTSFKGANAGGQVLGNNAVGSDIIFAHKGDENTPPMISFRGIDSSTKTAIKGTTYPAAVGSSDPNGAYESGAGSDTFFFVSGSANSLGKRFGGAAVFGGDMYITGNIHVEGTNNILKFNENVILNYSMSMADRANADPAGVYPPNPPMFGHDYTYGPAATSRVKYDRWWVESKQPDADGSTVSKLLLAHEFDSIIGTGGPSVEGIMSSRSTYKRANLVLSSAYSRLVLSGNGTVAISRVGNPDANGDDGGILRFAGSGSNDGAGGPFGPQIFYDTPNKRFNIENRGADNVNHPIRFMYGTVTASNGLHFGRANAGSGKAMKDWAGQALGISFRGNQTTSLGSNYSDAGLFYNEGTNRRNRYHLGPQNTLILTASSLSSNVKVGAAGVLNLDGYSGIKLTAGEWVHPSGQGGASAFDVYATGAGVLSASNGWLFYSDDGDIDIQAGTNKPAKRVTLSGSNAAYLRGGNVLKAQASELVEIYAWEENPAASSGQALIEIIARNNASLREGNVYIDAKSNIVIGERPQNSSYPEIVIGNQASTLTSSINTSVHVRGSGIFDGNLTVRGDFIKGHVISASVGDPLLLLNSGAIRTPPGAAVGSTTMTPSGGGVAIASGSTIDRQAMVFGRSTVHNNTFIAGRMDVKDGVLDSLVGAVAINVHGAGLRLAPGMVLTSSQDTGGGGSTHHVTMSNDDSEGSITFRAGPVEGDPGSEGRVLLSGSMFSFKSGQPIILKEGGTHGGGGYWGDISFNVESDRLLARVLPEGLRLVDATGNEKLEFGASDSRISARPSGIVPGRGALEIRNNAGSLYLTASGDTGGGSPQGQSDIILSASRDIRLIVGTSTEGDGDTGRTGRIYMPLDFGQRICFTTGTYANNLHGLPGIGITDTIATYAPGGVVQFFPGDLDGYQFYSGKVYIGSNAKRHIDTTGLDWYDEDLDVETEGGIEILAGKNATTGQQGIELESKTTGGGWIKAGVGATGQNGLLEYYGGGLMVMSSSNWRGSSAIGHTYTAFGSHRSSLATLFSETHFHDVTFFVSGSMWAKKEVDQTGISNYKHGVAVFGGDTVISGALYTSASYTDRVHAGDVLLTGSDGAISFQDEHKIYITKDSGGNLVFKDAVVGGTKTLTDLSNAPVADNATVFHITHGAPSYVVTTGSFSFDTLNRKTNVTPAPGGPGTDTYFFVSGSRGARNMLPSGLHQRGVTLFAGDVHVSGTLTSTDSVFGGSLQNAYNTPDGGGTQQTGIGGTITVSPERPVTLKQWLSDKAISEPILQLSGGIKIGQLRIAPSVDAGVYKNAVFYNTASDGQISFGTGGTAEVNTAFKISATNANVLMGVGNLGNGKKLGFSPSEASTYLQYTNNNASNPGPRVLHMKNLTTDGRISLAMGASGAANGSGYEGILAISGSIEPGFDNVYNLGSADKRFANLYTGDLHLRNERGDWTIYEEPDMLVVVNNLTGKKYKMGLTPLEDDE